MTDQSELLDRYNRAIEAVALARGDESEHLAEALDELGRVLHDIRPLLESTPPPKRDD